MIRWVISLARGSLIVRVDADTKRAIRNAADEHAAENGYRFDAERVAHVCEFGDLDLADLLLDCLDQFVH